MTLADTSGVEVDLVDVGAAVDVIRMPDRSGRVGDVTLRVADHHRLDPEHNPFVGQTIGPYANPLVDDQGRLQLHGGPGGFGWQRWDLVHTSTTSATFALGRTTAEYRLRDGALEIHLEAIAERTEPLSMTNHTYWNLGGPLAEHELDLAATGAVPTDDALLPTGPPEALTTPATLPGDYDTCFVIAGTGFRRHATIRHPTSGRRVEIWSDHPASQLYTGCWIDGVQGIAVEPQHVPNAPHLDWAPSPVLSAGDNYRHHLGFRFVVDPQEDHP